MGVFRAKQTHFLPLMQIMQQRIQARFQNTIENSMDEGLILRIYDIASC